MIADARSSAATSASIKSKLGLIAGMGGLAVQKANSRLSSMLGRNAYRVKAAADLIGRRVAQSRQLFADRNTRPIR